METESVQQLLARKRSERGESAPSEVKSPFYHQQPVEWPLPLWLEIRRRNGQLVSFDATSLSWVSYDPESAALDFNIEGFAVRIHGIGLYPQLYEALRTKRVAWVKEADSNMQEPAENGLFIEQIEIN